MRRRTSRPTSELKRLIRREVRQVTKNRVKKPQKDLTKNPLTARGLLGKMVSNYFTTRSKMSEQYRGGFGIDPPGRDLDYECGYPEVPDVPTFRRLYNREGYAKRVVDVWPDECWAVRPELYETDDFRVTKFERAWKRLNQRINVWHYLHRADRLSGIGCFGIILLGLDDGKRLDQPVDGVNRRGRVSKKRPKKAINLVYLKPFSEENVDISEIETDKTNPRFGQPRFYDIRIVSTTSRSSRVEETVKVHWTRVIHVADNRDQCDEAGVPRMLPVLNRILDIRKTLGSSAEMFYKGGFPGLSFSTVPELIGESVMDEDTIREQVEEYMEGLKRYLANDGVKVDQLLPMVADPSNHIIQQVQAICACLSIPLRVFLGSESGHLASTQDMGTWNKRVAERQMLYVEPMLIRPFVDRLVMIGVLPDPGEEDYLISWRDLNTMSDIDKANVALKRAQAMMQYVSGGVEAVMPPKQFYTLILGLSESETEAVMGAVDENKAKQLTDPLGDKAAKRDAKLNHQTVLATTKMKLKAKPQGGGRIGNPAKKSGGRPAGKIQQNAA